VAGDDPDSGPSGADADIYAFFLPDPTLRTAAETTARAALGDNTYNKATTTARSLAPSAAANLA
jgi:hypothetical protein